MSDTKELLKKTVAALEDIKAEEIMTIDVRGVTVIADYLVICTARSSRHLKAVADELFLKIKPLLVEGVRVNGDEASGWLIADLGDIVVHIMTAETRQFYALEKLWQSSSSS